MHLILRDAQPRVRPGERLTQQLWLRALAPGGRLPMPTIERIRAVKELVATWTEEHDD
ncbi:MAG TPA: hypothetical protein VIL88_15710 [Devosia sp.]|jgi:hypothetical protein|uniref:hypothetical protein n=1 Tax=Devosia sp. TaxID=1871048 RepID=UPI002F93A950